MDPFQGEVVYAYFGREKDFKELEDLGVAVEGKVVLARYGEVFRANIVSGLQLAELNRWSCFDTPIRHRITHFNGYVMSKH